MSHEKNFVSELVQMARAFEELPVVQADLMTAKNNLNDAMNNIQRLELRLIDAANEIEAAHSATRKAEVERDHAENMFLETDQRLDSLRHIFDGFKGQVDLFIKASEPVKAVEPEPATMQEALADPTKRHDMFPEDVYYQPAQPKAEAHEVTVESPLAETGQPVPTSVEPQATNTDTVSNTTSPGEAGLFGNTDSGQSAADPIAAHPDPIGTGMVSEASSSEGVSVSPDPITSGVETTQSGPTSDASDQTAQPDTAAAIVTSEPAPQDDVGYHNEPDIATHEWLGWYDRMNVRYGNRDGWPVRAA